jgi:hypothetical protein
MNQNPKRSIDDLMDSVPDLLRAAADAARARARDTGTPIVIVRDGVLVRQHNPPPIAVDCRAAIDHPESA